MSLSLPSHPRQAISNFETDFSNGALFGEILAHYGVLTDAQAFSKK